MRLFERTKIRRDQQESSFVILDDVVCFPGSMMPLYINARPALLAVDAAMAAHRFLFLANRKPKHEGLDIDDMCRVGTLVRIVQVMKLPNNGYRLLVEGLERAGLDEILDTSDNPRVLVQPLELDNTVNTGLAQLMKVASETFTRYSVLHKKVPKDAIAKIEQADAPHKLVDLIASHAQLSYETKLSLLENLDPVSRLRELSVAMEAECELLDLRHDISGRVKKRMEQNQKEYFINEQIRELNKELGKEEDDASGIKELESRLKAKDLPDDARQKTQNEIKRLGRLQPMTPEAGIVRTYLEWICDLPWGRGLPDKISISEAERILNEDHYDLEDAKDRLLDYLAVRRIRNDLKAPILCFVGPPGTGKTSLGKSLARALGRPFVRISLGGVRDEAAVNSCV